MLGRDFPKSPAPRYRRSSRRRGSGAVLFPLIIFVAAAMICGGFWLFAVRSLEDLPAREALEQASANASAGGSGTAAAPRPGGPARTGDAALAGEPSRPDAEAGPDLADVPPERIAVVETNDDEARGVRYVERAGIVSPRPDGPLVREKVTVVLPPPPGPEPTLHKLVVIESAGVVNVRSHRIKLSHIAAPGADEMCPSAAGGTWPCGARARTALRRLVRRRAIECLEPGEEVSEEPVREADCTVAGKNLSEWLVTMGWARPAGENVPEAYQALHQAAVDAQRGLFQPDGR